MVTYRVLIYRVSIEWSHIECSHRVVTHTLHFVFIFTLFGVSCRDNFQKNINFIIFIPLLKTVGSATDCFKIVCLLDFPILKTVGSATDCFKERKIRQISEFKRITARSEHAVLNQRGTLLTALRERNFQSEINSR